MTQPTKPPDILSAEQFSTLLQYIGSTDIRVQRSGSWDRFIKHEEALRRECAQWKDEAEVSMSLYDTAAKDRDRHADVIEKILAALPDNSPCKFEETGYSIADDVRDHVADGEKWRLAFANVVIQRDATLQRVKELERHPTQQAHALALDTIDRLQSDCDFLHVELEAAKSSESEWKAQLSVQRKGFAESQRDLRERLAGLVEALNGVLNKGCDEPTVMWALLNAALTRANAAPPEPVKEVSK